MMRLGKTVKRAQLLKIEAQVSSVWAKWCMFDDCVYVCVIYLTGYDYPFLVEEGHGI